MTESIARFSFPTTISYGPGAIRELPDNLAEAHIHKPLAKVVPHFVVDNPRPLKVQHY